MHNKFSPSLSATIATLLGFGVLIFLGTWQALKVGPKTEMIASIQDGLKASPIVFDATNKDMDYRRVTLSGTVVHATPIKVFNSNLAGKPGYHLYLPVVTANKAVVMVNLGWIPMDHVAVPALPVGEVLALSGLLRVSATPAMMQPENDVTSDVWYVANVDQMGAYFSISNTNLYPLRLFADHWPDVGELPMGGQLHLDIPNNHFSYMMTWYGLALALLGVYLVFGFTRNKN